MTSLTSQPKTKRVTHYLVMFCVSLFLMQMVSAHEIEKTSAQVILRDGQVEVRLYVNTEHWIETLQDPVAWLTGESDFLFLDTKLDTDVKVETDDLSSDASERVFKLSDYLLAEINLEIDSNALSLNATDQVKITGKSKLTEFRFSAKHSCPNPQSIAIQFPESLGEVHFSVTQPQYGLIPAGASSTFLVGSQ